MPESSTYGVSADRGSLRNDVPFSGVGAFIATLLGILLAVRGKAKAEVLIERAVDYGALGRVSVGYRPYDNWKAKIDDLEESLKVDLTRNHAARRDLILYVEEDEELNEHIVGVADPSKLKDAQRALENTRACLAYLRSLTESRAEVRAVVKQAKDLDKATAAAAAENKPPRRL